MIGWVFLLFFVTGVTCSMDAQVMVGPVAPDYWRYDLITDRSHLFGCALVFFRSFYFHF